MAASKGPTKGKLTFIDLPLETQKNICRHVDQLDLLSLLRVSRHFFSLAGAEIYRVLDFNFASSDVDSGAPISRTADALQAVVASDRDYGLHIRIFRLGVSEENSHNALLMSRVLWDSVADPSKVLNTLILLMVKKAGMMESFLWDTPIELSGSVYQALHNVQSLRHLRVRLDVPASMKTTVHQTFPPTPHLPTPHAPPSGLASAYPIPQGPSQFSSYTAAKLKRVKRRVGYNYWANGRAFSGFKNLHSLSLLGISNLDCLGEIAGCLKASSAALKSLTLSLSNELALKARKPSTPTNVVEDVTDTDGDDDEDLMDGPYPATTSGQQVNEADIRKEKLAQEGILAKIFDLQAVAVQGRNLERSVARPSIAVASKMLDDESLSSMKDFRRMLKRLLDTPPGSLEKESMGRETLGIMKKVIEKYLSTHPKATKKALKDMSKQTFAGSSKFPMTSKPSGSSQPGLESTGSDWTIQSSYASAKKWAPNSIPTIPSIGSNYMIEETAMAPPTDSLLGTGKQSSSMYPDSYMDPYVSDVLYGGVSPALSKAHNGHSESNGLGTSLKAMQHSNTKPGKSPYGDLEMMNSSNQESAEIVPETVKDLDNNLEMYDFGSEYESDGLEDASAPLRPPLFPAVEPVPQDREDSMDIDMEHPDEDTIDVGSDQEIIVEPDERDTSPRKRARFAAAEPISPANLQESAEQGKSSSADHDRNIHDNALTPSAGKSSDEEMRDYILANHGLQLEELSLYLIPLKASILARGLDLNVLRRLTLLNVGSQDPFWLLLARLQNPAGQISFKSIHTDNVSLPFLEFLRTFEGLDELFLLERNTKGDADAGSFKSVVNITTIRKFALRKHIGTLKRLLIRNDNDDTWDLDAHTIRFLSGKGASIIEMAISLSIMDFHILMQQLPGFKNLFALQFVSIRSTDRSSSLQIESLAFAADTLTHLPGQKLKYLALDNLLGKVERKQDSLESEAQRRKKMRKAKGKGKAKAAEGIGLDDSSGSDDADDLSDVASLETRLKFGVDFWEVIEEVKIFTREIRTGKL